MGAMIGLEHAPFPKVIRLLKTTNDWLNGFEHAPFPKVIRCYPYNVQ